MKKQIKNVTALLFALIGVGLMQGWSRADGTPDATAPQQKPTLWLIGDSTVRVGTRGQMGWGDAIGACFDPERITVVNRARSARSSRTYRTEGLWKGVPKLGLNTYLSAKSADIQPWKPETTE